MEIDTDAAAPAKLDWSVPRLKDLGTMEDVKNGVQGDSDGPATPGDPLGS